MITRLVGVAIVLLALAPAVGAQTAGSFTGKWEGKVLTGTARPADRQWKVEKGAVEAGKATFEVQQPDGPLFKFTLTMVEERLQGDMAGEREGVVRGHAKVDAAKAK